MKNFIIRLLKHPFIVKVAELLYDHLIKGQGRRFKVTASQEDKYSLIITAYRKMEKGYGHFATITDDAYIRLIIQRQTPWKIYRIEQVVLPRVIYEFLMTGGSLKNVRDFESVRDHRMLNGKKRRLIVGSRYDEEYAEYLLKINR